MSITLQDNNCAYCDSWVGPTDIHWCEQMRPNWTPEWIATRIDPNAPGGPLDRIASALERIALALEKPN
jgi:hypothetical protein